MKCVQIQSFFWSVFSPNSGKNGPEKTPYLNTFHAMIGQKWVKTKLEWLESFSYAFCIIINPRFSGD